MGTMGAGPFENDSALDEYHDVVDGIVRQLEKEYLKRRDFEIEDQEPALALVAILETLGRHCSALCLPRATVAGWKARFLSVYDEEIDGLEPTNDYRRRRREVIARTFDRLAKHIYHPDDPPPPPPPKAKAKAKKAPANRKATPKKAATKANAKKARAR